MNGISGNVFTTGQNSLPQTYILGAAWSPRPLFEKMSRGLINLAEEKREDITFNLQRVFVFCRNDEQKRREHRQSLLLHRVNNNLK